MKKILSFLLLAVIAVGANAQKDSTNGVWFKIQKEGRFATEDGKEFVIYHQEGKTAKELYDIVCVNINRMYHSPQNVLNTVDNKSVNLRAISESCYYDIVFGTKCFREVHFNLIFEFKDERIKIYAPEIFKVNNVSFRQITKHFYDAYGKKLTKSGKKRKEFTESYFNGLIWDLLGKSSSEPKDDDW